MATQTEEFSLTLKDLFTAKLKEAGANADQFVAKMDGVKSKMEGLSGGIKSIFGAIGVGLVAYKGIETVKEGIEKVHQLHAAEAQLKAGLASTGEAAGVSFENLEEMAKNFSGKFKYSRAEVMDMQSVLLTFPSVTKATFEDASTAIFNMATRMGGDVKGTTVQIGKALQDPIHGITALKRVGVNFSEAQKDVIQKLVDTGQTAKAQQLILKELNVEFGGSAAAAAAADPLFKYNKAMGSMKMALGEAAVSAQQVLAPALMVLGDLVKGAAGFVRDFVSWLKEHKEIVKAVAIGIGMAATAYGIYLIAMNAGTIATTIATTATTLFSVEFWKLNLAMLANPVGLVIAGIAALAAVFVYAWDKSVKFRAFMMGLWGALKELGAMIKDYFEGIGMMIKGALSFDLDEMKKGFNKSTSVFKEGGTRVAKAFKDSYDAEMADYKKKQEEDAKKKKEVPAIKPGGNLTEGAAPGAATGKDKPKKDVSPSGAGGTKSVTITISINKLIEQFKVSTTTVGEGAAQIKEKVAETLLGAINDSQIVAGI